MLRGTPLSPKDKNVLSPGNRPREPRGLLYKVYREYARWKNNIEKVSNIQQLCNNPQEQKGSRRPTRPWDERSREGVVNKGL